MTTLLIHPADRTTEFLKVGYESMDYTKINTNPSNAGLKRSMMQHDRIVMMGHGTNYGLIGFNRLVVSSQLVYLLREKPNSVYIWCNADQFVRKYALSGFATGMIISEYEEALLCCMHEFTAKDIDESNALFGEAIRQSIMLPPLEMQAKMLEIYRGNENPIIYFNRQRLYTFGHEKNCLVS